MSAGGDWERTRSVFCEPKLCVPQVRSTRYDTEKHPSAALHTVQVRIWTLVWERVDDDGWRKFWGPTWRVGGGAQKIVHRGRAHAASVNDRDKEQIQHARVLVGLCWRVDGFVD